MGTENRSPSYLAEREAVRKWLLETRDGQFATEMLRREAPHGNLVPFLDDDRWAGWEDIYRDYRDAMVLASNCAEARETARMVMQSRAGVGTPAHGPSRLMRFFSPPLSLVLRRQVETQDPDYWNDPQNVLREALGYPEYACVPVSFLRAQLESLLPRGTKVIITPGGIVERRETEGSGQEPTARLRPDPDAGQTPDAQELPRRPEDWS